MERVIKFRGISIQLGEWIKGYYIVIPQENNDDKHFINPEGCEFEYNEDYEVKPETVGQLIDGVTDSTHTENPYEGDIVEFRYSDYSEPIRVVLTYQNGSFGIPVENFTIIGNVHENSNLL